MRWFVEEQHPASTGWTPSLYRERPNIGPDMRIKLSNGSGPRVRKAPVEIDPRDHGLGLYHLQKIYGGE